MQQSHCKGKLKKLPYIKDLYEIVNLDKTFHSCNTAA